MRTRKEFYEGGTIPWLLSGEVNQREIRGTQNFITEAGLKNSSAKLFPPETLLIAMYGATAGQVGLLKFEACTNQAVCGVLPSESFSNDFLYYVFLWKKPELVAQAIGNAQPNISQEKIRRTRVPVPPLSEQKRIVEILDEVFDGIAKATSNAQRNLANAKLLHQRYIEVSLRKLWKNVPVHFLSDVCVVERGSSPRPIKSFLTTNANGVNWIKIGDVSDEDKFVIQTKEKITPEGAKQSRRVYPGDFILTNSMSYGRPYIMKIEGCVHDGWFVLRLKENISPDYFYFVLSSPQVQEQFGKLASGSVVLNIRSELVKQASFPVPPFDEKVKLANLFDSSLHQQKRLCDMYQKKIDKLDQLKQSLLHKAFTGQLAAISVSSLKAQEILTTTPKFTADIISYAFFRHEREKRDRTFGHVKAQKILHFVETIGQIDLGRKPVKDAAGPNDFAHMLRAEEWAKGHNYFAFNQRQTGGYDFKKLKKFGQSVTEAKAELASFLPKIDKIIDLFIPLNKEESEILATTYAAWNNLIIDGAKVTDDAIITEARENWHESKMRYAKDRFCKAIRLIRERGIIPDGSAKPVRHEQERLF